MTSPSTPSLLDRLRKFDPAVLPILIAAVVLVGAVIWLLGRPVPTPGADPRFTELGSRIGALEGRAAPDLAAAEARATARAEALERRLATLEGRTGPDLAPLREQLGELGGRLAAVENRAGPDLAPLRDQAAALENRVTAAEGRAIPDIAPLGRQIAALETRLAAAEGRAIPDIAPLGRQIAALENRLAAAEARAIPDVAPLQQDLAALGTRLGGLETSLRDLAARPVTDQDAARRGALEQLAQAVQTLTERTQQSLAALDQALGANAGRVTAAESGLAARAQASDALAARLGTLEQQAGQRIGAVEQQAASRAAAIEQSLGTRLTTLEQQLASRGQAIEQHAARLATLEGTGQRLSALEGQAARMAALDQVRTALDAGRPLGGSLAQLPTPPEALTRFATAAPPTEAQLRLSFEDAARAGRAASEPPAGPGVMDSAVARLQGLVTVRRGEQVLWGDAAAAEIERARRAVEAGDIEAALGHLQKLSPQARQAMAGWIGQAEALVAARAALRQLAAG